MYYELTVFCTCKCINLSAGDYGNVSVMLVDVVAIHIPRK